MTASTTKEKFAAAVREALGAAATRNISITAKIEGEPKKPTTEGTGEIKFVLTIKDLSKKPSVSGYSKTMSAITYTLPKLDNLTTCIGKITTGLTEAVISTIVNDAKKAAPTALDAKVQEMLITKANSLIVNNPNITVKGIATADGEKVYKLVAPTKAAKDSDAKIYFSLELQDATTGVTHEAADLVVAIGSEGSEKSLEACDAFQSLEELKTAVAAFNKVTIAAGGSLPATEAEAISAAQAEIRKLKTGVDLTNTITAVAETTEGENKTTYEKNDEDKITAVKKLKVTISGVDDPIVINSVAIEVATSSGS